MIEIPSAPPANTTGVSATGVRAAYGLGFAWLALVSSLPIAAIVLLQDLHFDLDSPSVPIAIQVAVPTVVVTLFYAPLVACGMIAALLHRSVIVRTLLCLVLSTICCLGGALVGEFSDSSDRFTDTLLLFSLGSLVGVVLGFFLYQFRNWRIRIRTDERPPPKSSLLNWMELTAVLGISFAFYGGQLEDDPGYFISTGVIYAITLTFVTPMILIASTLVACYLGDPKRPRRARIIAAAFFLLTAYAAFAFTVIADSGLDINLLLQMIVPAVACVITGTLSVAGMIAVLRRCGWRLVTRRDQRSDPQHR